MDKRFIDAINADDFVTVRDMLKNRLLMDHDVNGGMFDECWTECESAGSQRVLRANEVILEEMTY